MQWPEDIVRGFWTPAWAIQLDLKLNHIHADQEKIMAEIDDLRTAVANVKTEVSEAVAKFNEQAQALKDAIANIGNLAELRTAVSAVATELQETAAHLDTAFGTQFDPSTL